MKSLTERRISSKVRALEKWIDSFYVKVFPVSAPDEQFWSELEVIETELAKKLAREGITSLMIEGACSTFKKKFQAACLAAKRRVQQARKTTSRDGKETGGAPGS